MIVVFCRTLQLPCHIRPEFHAQSHLDKSHIKVVHKGDLQRSSIEVKPEIHAPVESPIKVTHKGHP